MRLGLFYLTLCVILLLGSAFAEDLIILDNGTQMRGFVIAWSSGYTMVYFQPEDKKEEPLWIPVSDIKTMRFSVPAVRKDKRPEPQKKDKEKNLPPSQGPH